MMDLQLLLELRIPRVALPPVGKRIVAGDRRIAEKLSLEWCELVDVDILDSENPNDCIHGQLFDHFYIGCCELRITAHEAVLLGFSIPNPDSATAGEEFRILTRGWRKFLKRPLRLA